MHGDGNERERPDGAEASPAERDGPAPQLSVGWIGAGRMGYELAKRLLDAGVPVTVYNRTRSKAEPLADLGASLVDSPRDLAGCDLVFTVVGGSDDFLAVTTGPDGVLAAEDRAPSYLVDISTVSAEASAQVREHAARRGTVLLAAPVSGNPKVVRAGRLTIVVSGPEDAYAAVRPYLETLAGGVTYVGDGDRARLVKICHNLMLGVVTQCLAEIVVLAEKGGVSRTALLEFLNQSVMGSTFTRYKAPAMVTLDFAPTFTPELLRKDFDLGLEAGAELGVPLPVAELVRSLVDRLVQSGFTDVDFATLLVQQADASGLPLEPEPGPIPDGLESPAPASTRGSRSPSCRRP
jgi:3-hydroxyisobutyrate dehydrogenase